jgi:hypothetical protein
MLARTFAALLLLVGVALLAGGCQHESNSTTGGDAVDVCPKCPGVQAGKCAKCG